MKRPSRNTKMGRYSSFALLLTAAAAAALAQGIQSNPSPSNSPCDKLAAAGLKSQLLFPNSTAYAEREASYWAPNARLGPSCILQPRTTDEVSRAIQDVAASPGIYFAVRSGGHVQWAGGSDVGSGGVTIDLGAMVDVTYDAETTVASTQPGPRWGDVFSFLEPYGVAPTGGRDADVGIGGFLTGGGNAYLSARNGFGCDTVVNFQVVLGNGTVVDANRTANSDLWRALKGGWANFGIVTRFDVETTAISGVRGVWGDTRTHDASVGVEDQVAAALVKFTNENEEYPAAAHLVLRTYNTVIPEKIGMVTVMVDTEGFESAPIFEDIEAIPSLTSNPQSNTTLGRLAEQGVDPSDDRVHWFTLTFRNDVGVVRKAMALHDVLVDDIKTALGNSGSSSSSSTAGFSTQCVLQPLPSFFADIGARKGGNMLGLDSDSAAQTGTGKNSILWLGTVAYRDPAHDAMMHEKLASYFRELEKFVVDDETTRDDGHGRVVEWRYINYADRTQKNPLASYGEDNLAFMREVAAKYDPGEVFQRLMMGGWKLSDVS